MYIDLIINECLAFCFNNYRMLIADINSNVFHIKYFWASPPPPSHNHNLRLRRYMYLSFRSPKQAVNHDFKNPQTRWMVLSNCVCIHREVECVLLGSNSMT